MCRHWKAAAEDEELWKVRFARRFGLGKVTGRAASKKFYADCSLASFAKHHRRAGSDTITSLALQYRTDVTALKRLNNFITDSSLFSREVVLIPVTDAAEIAGQPVRVAFLPEVFKDVALVGECMRAAPEGADSQQTKERMEKLRVELLSRSMKIDQGTARYYLDQAGDDIKEAIASMRDDLAWESQARSSRSGPAPADSTGGVRSRSRARAGRPQAEAAAAAEEASSYLLPGGAAAASGGVSGLGRGGPALLACGGEAFGAPAEALAPKRPRRMRCC